jgi:phosphate transport system substrate-binding protein
VRRAGSRTGLLVVVAAVVIVVLIVGVGFATNWYGTKNTASSPPGVCPKGVTLLGAGASFISPIMSKWVAAFDTNSSDQVSYTGSGAGAGITALQTKTVDFGATDEPLNSSQVSGFGGQVLTLPITAGALAIIYNLPGITQPINLSATVIAGIYLGLIATWNAGPIQTINPGVTLPNDKIVPVVRSDAAGTTFVLTDFLSKGNATWNTTVGTGISVQWPKTPVPVEEEHGNSGVASQVFKTPYSISYTDLADANLAKDSFAKVQNPAGQFIYPTATDTASALADAAKGITFPNSAGNWQGITLINAPGSTDYPLAVLAYAFIYQKADMGYQAGLNRTQVIVDFLSWVLSPTGGQAQAASLQYVQLPSALLSIDQAGLGTMTFNGQSIPACT